MPAIYNVLFIAHRYFNRVDESQRTVPGKTHKLKPCLSTRVNYEQTIKSSDINCGLRNSSVPGTLLLKINEVITALTFVWLPALFLAYIEVPPANVSNLNPQSPAGIMIYYYNTIVCPRGSRLLCATRYDRNNRKENDQGS